MKIPGGAANTDFVSRRWQPMFFLDLDCRKPLRLSSGRPSRVPSPIQVTNMVQPFWALPVLAIAGKTQEATTNFVPANKLAALPAIRYALSTRGTFAKSACGLLKNDSSPRKENPRLRMTRLMPAENFRRRLCLFVRALCGDTASALIFQTGVRVG